MKTIATRRRARARLRLCARPRPLQLCIGSGASIFTCFDGELSCDQSGGANNLLTVDTTVGGAFVQLTLTQSTFGKVNELQLSSVQHREHDRRADHGHPARQRHRLRRPGDASSTTRARSPSISNVGAPDSTLKFWADAPNTQGANPTNTPGTLLESVSGHALTDPDSFSGSKVAAFAAGAPFSMTEGAALALRSDGSVTGFNQAMETGVPEPSTWAMLILGFAGLAWAGVRRGRSARFALVKGLSGAISKQIKANSAT